MNRPGSPWGRNSDRSSEHDGAKAELDTSREFEMMDETLMDVTADELREFLEADVMDVRADPAFKEALRRRLWEFVLARKKDGSRRIKEEN